MNKLWVSCISDAKYGSISLETRLQYKIAVDFKGISKIIKTLKQGLCQISITHRGGLLQGSKIEDNKDICSALGAQVRIKNTHLSIREGRHGESL